MTAKKKAAKEVKSEDVTISVEAVEVEMPTCVEVDVMTPDLARKLSVQ